MKTFFGRKTRHIRWMSLVFCCILGIQLVSAPVMDVRAEKVQYPGEEAGIEEGKSGNAVLNTGNSEDISDGEDAMGMGAGSGEEDVPGAFGEDNAEDEEQPDKGASFGDENSAEDEPGDNGSEGDGEVPGAGEEDESGDDTESGEEEGESESEPGDDTESGEEKGAGIGSEDGDEASGDGTDEEGKEDEPEEELPIAGGNLDEPDVSAQFEEFGLEEEPLLEEDEETAVCEDEYCSHVYRDLDEELFPICDLGEQMLTELYGEIALFSGDAAGQAEPIVENVALNKPVKAFWTADGSSAVRSDGTWAIDNAVDGIKETGSYGEFGLYDRDESSYFQVDLGSLYVIESVSLYRYWSDGRTYNGTVIALSATSDFEDPYIVYNSDADNVHGFGAGSDSVYQESEDGYMVKPEEAKIARYVRIYMHGSNKNYANHIVELEVNGYESDPYYNQGIYFVSIPDLYRQSAFQASPAFEQEEALGVNAVFTNEEGTERIFRMVELQEGIFGTVVPPRPEGESSYDRITFTVTVKSGESTETAELPIIYDFTAAGDQDDRITALPGEDGKGEGIFSYASTTRDCFYWDDDYRTSYWGGHPSNDEKILDQYMIYIDNDPDGTYASGDLVWPDGVWISYYDERSHSVVSEKATKQTRRDSVTYYLFETNCGLTEHSLLAISNGKLNEAGEFETPSDSDKVYYTMYNIGSGDNLFILRNLENQERIWGHFHTEGDRYVAFRDQLYGQDGALVAGEADNPAAGKVQYWLPEDETASSENAQWQDMAQNTDESAGADTYKLFFTDSINIDQKYIQFRILDENGAVKYTSDIETINDDYAYPCFFADVYQKSSGNYQSREGGISGYWTTIFKSSGHGDESRDVPQEENATYNPDYYYATADFYDYYSDYELQGNRLDTATGFGVSQGGTTYEKYRIGSILNNAISEYFKKNGKQLAYPFYYGGSRDGVDGTEIGSNLYRKEDYGNLTDHRVGYNAWTSGLNYSYGYVDEELDAEGNLTTAGVPYPQFSESFLRGDNFLNTALGYAYNSVAFPFQMNAEGYWEYDSSQAEHAVRLKEDPKTGYYLELTEDPVKTGADTAFNSINSFLPFNSSSSTQAQLNMIFGMRLELPFHITEDGTVQMPDADAPGGYSDQDIIFSFSGDDDFLLYIDGKLALDLAGVHDPLYGKINFATGEVTTHKINKDLTVDTSEEQTHDQENLYESRFSREELASGTHMITIFYSERGLGTSNLKMEFNFPYYNQLDITNQVNTDAANPLIFKDALEYLGSFNYELRNQATSGSPLAVEASAGYLSNADTVEFNDFSSAATYRGISGQVTLTEALEGPIPEGRDRVLKLQNDESTSELNYDEMADEIVAGNYWVTIDYTGGDSADLSEMAYLRVEAYNDSDLGSGSGRPLHVRLIDANGNYVQGIASELTHNAYNNTLPARAWVTLRLDLEKLTDGSTDFDLSRVTDIQFGFARGGSALYLDNLDFRGKITEGQSTGFHTGQNQISDYGSLSGTDGGAVNYKNAVLSPAAGAWYRIGNADDTGVNTAIVNDDGSLSIAGGQKASFFDKFREGSYIQITQNDPAKNDIFRTSWSILENGEKVDDNLLALYPGVYTVMNDPNLTDNTVTNVSGHTVSDDRNVILYSGGEISYIYPSGNRSNHVSGENNTLVFRGYQDPDNSQKTGIHLTAAYENDLIVGGLVITKELETADSEADHTYIFHVHYTDVGGLNLEANLRSGGNADAGGIIQTVEITVPKGETSGSAVLYGIPENTVYTVHEVNENPSRITVSGLYRYPKGVPDTYYGTDKSGLEPAEPTEENDHHAETTEDVYRVGGTYVTYDVAKGQIKESIQELTFTNEQRSLFGEVEIKKDIDSAYEEDQSFAFHIHYEWTEEEETKTAVVPITVTVPAGETEGSAVYANLPVGASYEIHEVDDTALTEVKAEAGCTELGSGTEPEENESKHHQNVKVSDVPVELTVSPDTDGTKTTVASGTAYDSRQTFTFVNKGANSVRLRKTDENGDPLDGAGFTLYHENGHAVQIQQMTENAEVSFKNLPPGSYYIRETTAPKGYERLTEKISFTLPYDGAAQDGLPDGVTLELSEGEAKDIRDVCFVVRNEKNDGKFTFYKENREGERLAGAVFALYELTCTEESHDHTSAGNDLIEAEEDGAFSAGYQYSGCWNLVHVARSGTDGTVSFTSLSQDIGTIYRLVELKAPDGYVTPNGQWVIWFNGASFRPGGSIHNPPAFSGAGTDILPYIVENYTYADIPLTGGRGWIYRIGTGLMALAMGFWIYNAIKKRKKRV